MAAPRKSIVLPPESDQPIPVSATPPVVDPAPAAKSDAEFDALMAESATFAGQTLDVATGGIIAVGESINRVLLAAKYRDADWTAKRFDATLADWNARYTALNPDSATLPDGKAWWATAMQVGACKCLGILEAERVAHKRWLAMVHAFDFDKVVVAVTVKEGWATWLKKAVPINRSGADSIAYPAFREAVEAQARHLFAEDEKKHPLPIQYRSKTPKAGPGTGGAGSNPAPKDKPAPTAPAPTATVPPVGKPAPAPTVTATVAKSAPADRVKMAVEFGKALLDSGDNDAIKALYRTIAKRVREIRESEETAKATA